MNSFLFVSRNNVQIYTLVSNININRCKLPTLLVSDKGDVRSYRQYLSFSSLAENLACGKLRRYIIATE